MVLARPGKPGKRDSRRTGAGQGQEGVPDEPGRPCAVNMDYYRHKAFLWFRCGSRAVRSLVFQNSSRLCGQVGAAVVKTKTNHINYQPIGRFYHPLVHCVRMQTACIFARADVYGTMECRLHPSSDISELVGRLVILIVNPKPYTGDTFSIEHVHASHHDTRLTVGGTLHRIPR